MIEARVHWDWRGLVVNTSIENRMAWHVQKVAPIQLMQTVRQIYDVDYRTMQRINSGGSRPGGADWGSCPRHQGTGAPKRGGKSKNNANLHNEKRRGTVWKSCPGTRNHRSASECRVTSVLLGTGRASRDECSAKLADIIAFTYMHADRKRTCTTV